MVMSPEGLVAYLKNRDESSRKRRLDEFIKYVDRRLTMDLKPGQLSLVFCTEEHDDSVVEEGLDEYRSAGYGIEQLPLGCIRISLPGYSPPSLWSWPIRLLKSLTGWPK